MLGQKSHIVYSAFFKKIRSRMFLKKAEYYDGKKNPYSVFRLLLKNTLSNVSKERGILCLGNNCISCIPPSLKNYALECF